MEDFSRCTPSEFREVFDAWNKLREVQEHSQWERVRMQCLCSLQPYSKNKLKASDVMTFPWEQEQKEVVEVKEELSREEKMARFRAAAAQWGLKC